MVVVLCTLFARKWESCQINMARNALEDLSSYKKKWNKITWMRKKEFGSTTPCFFHTLWITFEVHLLTMDKLGLGLFTLAFE
jgi:hypothetical protein